jgi:hypothetical protein
VPVKTNINGHEVRKQEFWIEVTREGKKNEFKCFVWNNRIEKLDVTKGLVELKGTIRTFNLSSDSIGCMVYATEIRKLSTEDGSLPIVPTHKARKKPVKYVHRDCRFPERCSGQYSHKHSECLKCAAGNTKNTFATCIFVTNKKKGLVK